MRTIIFTLTLLLSTLCTASDLAKEKRWVEQTVDSILDGEAVFLNADGHDFLTIYTQADAPSKRGMIVVHGTGIHPDWVQVVQPIRVEMATHGWNTLSIQMPILHNEATYEEYVPLYPEVPPRLKAAENFLIEQGMTNIVIVAHSQGATMSSYYLSRNESKASAFVAIGMGATQKDSELNSAESLKKISIPVLDLSGSEDLEGVLSTAALRKAAAKANPGYSAIVIDGADHFFEDYEEPLIDTIRQWLDQR